jgi:hypothetical protein
MERWRQAIRHGWRGRADAGKIFEKGVGGYGWIGEFGVGYQEKVGKDGESGVGFEELVGVNGEGDVCKLPGKDRYRWRG